MKNLPDKYKGKSCKNCGFELPNNENFCPNCGQKNDIRRPHLKIFWQSFLDSFLSFDNKVLLTVKELLLHPGKVSLEYVSGKRIRYVNPFRFLLNVSIIFFLVSNLPTKQNKTENATKTAHKNTFIANPKKINYEKYYHLVENFASKHHIDSLFNHPDIPLSQKENLYKNLLMINYFKIPDTFQFEPHKNTKLEKIKSYKFPTILYNTLVYKKYFSEHSVGFDPSQINQEVRKNFEEISWGIKGGFFHKVIYLPEFKNLKPKEILEKLNLTKNISNLFALKLQLFSYGDNNFKENVQQKILSYLPFTLYLFLPFFTLIMMAIFSDKKYNYTEQLIYIFYTQSLFFILSIFAVLLNLLLDIKWIDTLMFVVFAVYLFFGLKRFYEEKGFQTLIKMLFLVIPAYIVLASLSFVFALFAILLIT